VRTWRTHLVYGNRGGADDGGLVPLFAGARIYRLRILRTPLVLTPVDGWRSAVWATSRPRENRYLWDCARGFATLLAGHLGTRPPALDDWF